MAARIQHRLRMEPLAAQIVRAEQKLRQRRRRVDASAALLRQTARRQLTSPWALLLAGGVGFVAADFATRAPSTPATAPASRSFANALGILAVVRSLVSMLRPAAPPPVEPEHAEGAPRP